MIYFQLDALDSSHPIEVPVGPPSEVDEIFDNISYNKVLTYLGFYSKCSKLGSVKSEFPTTRFVTVKVSFQISSFQKITFLKGGKV
jgi:hypothetical protein